MDLLKNLEAPEKQKTIFEGGELRERIRIAESWDELIDAVGPIADIGLKTKNGRSLRDFIERAKREKKVDINDEPPQGFGIADKIRELLGAGDENRLQKIDTPNFEKEKYRAN